MAGDLKPGGERSQVQSQQGVSLPSLVVFFAENRKQQSQASLTQPATPPAAQQPSRLLLPPLLQEPGPHRSLLLRAKSCAASEAMQSGIPGSSRDPCLNEGGWQVAQEVTHNVHSVLISNDTVLKTTSVTDGTSSWDQARHLLRILPTPKSHEVFWIRIAYLATDHQRWG